MAKFIPRLTRPEAGNPYYNTKAKGGYSDAIEGNQTDAGCNVLRNCVGYAYGRFNEIVGAGCMKYLRPTNAENFLQNAGNLETGLEPRVGAVMVWRKGATLSGSDGAGHVAVVEQVLSSTKVVTSESGWSAKSAFWTQTRSKGSGNWGQGTGYTFLGFIYNPVVKADGTVTANAAINTGTTKAGKLTVDGQWGPATTKRLQEIFGLEQTGTVLEQHVDFRNQNPGLRSGWDWETDPAEGGDPLVRKLQEWAGLYGEDIDGKIGPNTIKAMQARLGTYTDGCVSNPSAMVRALQRWANDRE